jgi:hypothetical protein
MLGNLSLGDEIFASQKDSVTWNKLSNQSVSCLVGWFFWLVSWFCWFGWFSFWVAWLVGHSVLNYTTQPLILIS